MFGNNKKEAGKTKSNNFIASTPTNSLNSLVQGTVVEGTVRSESDIRVDGLIKGKLFCDAKVIIGPSGAVEGEINCENAVIEGRFEGSINVRTLLTVKASANVSGDVTTQRLIIDDGATFNGNCDMGAKKNTNQKNGVVKINKANTAASSPTTEKAARVG